MGPVLADKLRLGRRPGRQPGFANRQPPALTLITLAGRCNCYNRASLSGSSDPISAMRITCIIHSLAGGGAERVMAALASALTERLHQVTLITLDDGRQDRHSVNALVRRVTLDLMRPSRGRWSAVTANARRIARLRRAVAQSRPEAVLSFCDRTNVLTLLALAGTSVPVIVSERSNPDAQQMPWPWSVLRPRLYRRAAAVVVLTSAAAEIVAPWTAKPPIVIPSALSVPASVITVPASVITGPETRAASVAGDAPVLAEHGERRVIGIGRLEREKGFERLLEAFATVAERHPNWKLTIHGEGSCRAELERQRAQLGLSDRIDLPGWTRPIWPALAASELFVLPSRYEGFPSALLEAMSAGRACIAFDCPHGPAEAIRDGVDGLLVPADDTPALAAAMDRCMGDPELRLALGSRAAEVGERFSWSTMVDAYERLLLSQG